MKLNKWMIRLCENVNKLSASTLFSLWKINRLDGKLSWPRIGCRKINFVQFNVSVSELNDWWCASSLEINSNGWWQHCEAHILIVFSHIFCFFFFDNSKVCHCSLLPLNVTPFLFPLKCIHFTPFWPKFFLNANWHEKATEKKNGKKNKKTKKW